MRTLYEKCAEMPRRTGVLWFGVLETVEGSSVFQGPWTQL